jgi:hypothetical protein
MVSQRREALPAMLKYRGIFDFEGMLKLVYDWLIHEDYEVHERKYKHKIPDPRGAEQEITIAGWRRVNGYVKFHVEVDIHTYDQKDVDVIKEGVKKRLVQARIKMTFTPTVELDYTKRFAGNSFLQTLQDFYHKYIIRQEIQNYWEDELYYRTYKLHRLVKEWLDMETKTNAAEGRW